MRTVIDINEDLFDAAAEELGTKGRKATVNAALEHFARRHRQRDAVAAILAMDLDDSEATRRAAWRMDSHDEQDPQA